MRGKAIILLMIFSVIAAFSGCAGSKAYLIDIKYIPEKKEPPVSKVVGICPFEDARKGKAKNSIGVGHRPGKYGDLLKLKEGSLSKVTTQAVKDYFREKGFEVTDCTGWDKSPETFDRLPKGLPLVIGGKIDSFMVEAKSGITVTDIHYRVKMEAYIGHIQDRNVVIRTVESKPKTKQMGFNLSKIKTELNSIIKEVIQNLFK